jgi:hypothetical protein
MIIFKSLFKEIVTIYLKPELDYSAILVSSVITIKCLFIINGELILQT